MKKFLITIIALIIALPVTAGNIYRWVDKNGVYHFSDTPPTDTNYETEIIGTIEQIPSLTPVKTQDNTIKIDIYKNFKYIDKGFPFGLSVGHTRAVGMFRSPFERLTREPSYTSSKVLYGYLQLGNSEDNRITFAIDGLGSPIWMLYVDKNNNEDLTDDGPPYTNQGTGKFAALVSLQLDIITTQGERTKQPYKIWFWVKENRLREKIPYYYSRCYYSGQVVINGHPYDAIAFETDNHDGLYKESGICIDFDKDHKCSSAEHLFNGETIKVGNYKYQIVLDYP